MSISWRKLRAEVVNACEEYDTVFVMTSGGVDSMFLANFVVNAGIKPIIVHFQHGIRPDDQREAELVAKFAENHGLSFHLGKGQGLDGIKNQEAVARDQRWAFVEGLVARSNGKCIVLTAHHYDDNIEHFLMSAIRGRKLASLSMKKFCKMEAENFGYVPYTKFKPLLEIEKEEIYEQARRRKIEWIEDPTNADTDHERNVFRNTIIPELMKIRNIRTSMRGLFDEMDAA
jgi:tRNA(Ile)-lysidine synthetase-like protein